MLVVLAILSVALLGLIIYFAVSSRSSRLLKLSALIALGLIGLSVLICGVFLFIGPSQKASDLVLPAFLEEGPKARSGNLMALVVFLITVLFIVSLIIFIPMREKRKKERSIKKTGKGLILPDDEDLDMEEPEEKEEESFDIDFK